jgi:hypothetical protein
MSAAAARAATWRPIGVDFSAKMRSVMSARTAMFIIPSGKRIAKSSQQQPRQYTPCSRPMRKEPA